MLGFELKLMNSGNIDIVVKVFTANKCKEICFMEILSSGGNEYRCNNFFNEMKSGLNRL